MVCVYCGSPTQVVNSRDQRQSNNIWRRRKCLACGSIFTSIESADLASALRVSYSSHQLKPFVREKLFISLYESCKHRSTAIQDARNLTQQVINHLLTSPERSGLVTPQQIATVCRQVLEPFDGAAATFYVAYHPL